MPQAAERVHGYMVIKKSKNDFDDITLTWGHQKAIRPWSMLPALLFYVTVQPMSKNMHKESRKCYAIDIYVKYFQPLNKQKNNTCKSSDQHTRWEHDQKCRQTSRLHLPFKQGCVPQYFERPHMAMLLWTLLFFFFQIKRAEDSPLSLVGIKMI